MRNEIGFGAMKIGKLITVENVIFLDNFEKNNYKKWGKQGLTFSTLKNTLKNILKIPKFQFELFQIFLRFCKFQLEKLDDFNSLK